MSGAHAAPSDVVPQGTGRRLPGLTGRPPRQAHLILAALWTVGAALHALTGSRPAAIAPLVLVALAGPLWVSRRAARGHDLVAAAALLAGTTVPDAAAVAGVVAFAASLLACSEVLAQCADTALRAQEAVLAERAARDAERNRAEQVRSELSARVEHGSTHDGLTGLLNRAAVSQRLEDVLAADEAVGVLVVSLVGFSAVNDVVGDELGDEALTIVGRRLSGAARGTDLVARLGGDRFAVVMPGLRGEDAALAGERLTAGLTQPLALAGHLLPLHARAGLAVAERGSGASGRALLRGAESAADAAGTGGRIMLHDASAGGRRADRLRAEADLRRGLEAGEHFLLFQPLVSTATGQIASTEALVRWRHPQHGLVPPDAFIGLAEQSGLIVPLGIRVLELAIAQLRQWSDRAPALSVAVNVSARQLEDPDFISEARRVLWGSGVDPSRVVLELTESLFVEDGDAAAAVMWQLRGLGVRLALDDFGTGYSSLARLGDLPLDELKIDKSFVDRLWAQPGDSTSLVTAAAAMGHGLGLEVVAEGVETAAQAAFLRSVGVDLLQGYLLGRPMEADAVTPMLGRRLLPAADTVPAPRSDSDALPGEPFVPSVLPSLAPGMSGQRRRLA